jgi:hypothetical protein
MLSSCLLSGLLSSHFQSRFSIEIYNAFVSPSELHVQPIVTYISLSEQYLRTFTNQFPISSAAYLWYSFLG